MKRGTPDHPKTRRLARRLEIHLAQAVGHLEMLWHWTAKYAPHGDVGRHQDGDIEEGCLWNGPAGALVAALVAERFIDEDAAHRLVVHDWPEHADTAVHRQLARACQRFADGSAPKLTGLTRPERERAGQVFGVDGDDLGSHETTDGLPPDHRLTTATQSRGGLPRPAVPRPAPPSNGTPPSPPAADAAGGAARQEIERQTADLVGFGVGLGGHPDRKQRRQVREALIQGFTVEQLRGSISERVRDDLIRTGHLSTEAEWPPPEAPAQPP